LLGFISHNQQSNKNIYINDKLENCDLRLNRLWKVETIPLSPSSSPKY